MSDVEEIEMVMVTGIEMVMVTGIEMVMDDEEAV